jgi:putative transposase
MQVHEHFAGHLQAPPIPLGHRPRSLALLSVFLGPAPCRKIAPAAGIAVSYETIRRWGKKFDPDHAHRLRRNTPSGNDVCNLDEVVITISGRRRRQRRAADQDGYVLDEIVRTRRNTKAARRLLTRLLRKQGIAPKRMIADRLRPYGAVRRQVMPNVEYRSHKSVNNRAKNSHVPLRKGERMMQGFRSLGGLLHFVSVFSAVRNLFVLTRSKRSAFQNRVHRIQAIGKWNAAAGAMI